MVVDHIGAYLYVQDPAWRAFGRLSAPIWLFLVGYARSRNVNAPLIIGAALITIISFYVTQRWNALNILWVIIFIRLTINSLMKWINGNDLRLGLVTFTMFVLTPIIRNYWDYGTIAYIIAIWGHIARNGFSSKPQESWMYGIVALLAYFYQQIDVFHFNYYWTIFAGLGLAGLLPVLLIYFPKRKPGWVPENRIAHKIISYLGRHTLEFYVIHLIILYMVTETLCHCHGACICMPLGIDPDKLFH